MNQKDIIFDGHNDLLLRLWLAGDHGGNGFLQSTRVNGSDGHLDLKSTKEGNFSGGFFAIFSPSCTLFKANEILTSRLLPFVFS